MRNAEKENGGRCEEMTEGRKDSLRMWLVFLVGMMCGAVLCAVVAITLRCVFGDIGEAVWPDPVCDVCGKVMDESHEPGCEPES